MKTILIISSLLIYSFSFNYINEIKKLEMVVYNLYKTGFSDYLIYTNEGILSYNKENFKQYIEGKNYKINIFDKEDGLYFSLSFKNIFTYKKEFSFKLVKTNEF